MPHTEDFEHLLELENVRSVEWDGEKLLVRVSKKLPEAELEEKDIVNRRVPVDIEVIDEDDEPGKGHYELHDTKDTTFSSSAPDSKHRPVVAGVSEGHEDITAGTASIYPVEVVDTDKARWSANVQEGDYVRLSNNHVYAKVNKGKFLERIYQPGPHDGGTARDTSGRLAGYVLIEDGVTVDIAARTTTPEMDSADIHGLSGYNTGVVREGYDTLRGVPVVKSGRTTGVTTGTIENTSASVNVRIGDDTVVFRDMIISGKMGEGGDSGSPGFIEESGELFGFLFAGSPAATIFCKAGNVEDELGVRILSEEDDKPEPPEENRSLLQILIELIMRWLS